MTPLRHEFRPIRHNGASPFEDPPEWTPDAHEMRIEKWREYYESLLPQQEAYDNSVNARPVIVNGKRFGTLALAARYLGCGRLNFGILMKTGKRRFRRDGVWVNFTASFLENEK